MFAAWSCGLLRRRAVEEQRQADVLVLQENLSDLERELEERRQRLDFADQLLRKKETDNR